MPIRVCLMSQWWFKTLAFLQVSACACGTSGLESYPKKECNFFDSRAPLLMEEILQQLIGIF